MSAASTLSPVLGLGALGALGLLVLAARRPALACGVLALGIPLTAGMARGAAVPVLRVNEALLLVVVAGFLVHWLVRRRPLAFTGLDVVVLGFCLVSVVIPWAVILLSRAGADQSDWLVVLGPIQYLLVYLLFSRTEFAEADRRLLFNLLLAASIPVAAIAVAEALDLGPTRDVAGGLYPALPLPSWDTTYRPSSLLGHYSALGAFGLLNFLLALALSATRHPGFSQRWLAVAMGVNLLSVVVSQTYAPAVALVLGSAVVVVAAGRIPWRQATAAPPVLAVAGIVFWPSISGRIASQLSVPGGTGLPDSLQTRIDFWQGFFVPALLRHGLWLGTGTLMPPEVPRPLVDFVDNGYLWQLFRAGVPGLVVLLAMLGAVAGAGWAARRSQDPSHRAVGLVCAGAVVSVLLMDTTSEYLTFTAVSQEFWMLVGLLAGFAVAVRAPSRGRLVEVRPPAGPWTWPQLPPAPLAGAVRLLTARATALAARATALAAPGGLLRSSALLTAGNAAARFLGLLFSVAAARFLAPAGYGVLAYALVIANVGSILIVNAPLGLTRFLSRHRDEHLERDAHFTNWMTVIAAITTASMLLLVPAGLLAGLGGWLLPALLANLVGVAVLETYLQVECGLERFHLMVGFWATANLLQLVAALVAGLAGYRAPALFLAIYGLSSVAALAVLLPLAPMPLRLRPGTLSWERIRFVSRYTGPLVLMNAFTTVWLGADVVLVDRLVSPAAAGGYAAAKVVVNGFAIVSWAISNAVLPRASRLAGPALRTQLLRALGLTAVAVVPLFAMLALVARPLLGLVFGPRFDVASTPLVLLAAAMAAYAFYSVIESVWLGLGRPAVTAVAGGAGMAGLLLTGPGLVHAMGVSGAALAFGIGSAAQLAVLAALTLRSGQLRGEDGRPGAAPDAALAVLAARVERLARDYRDLPRRILWRGRPGYDRQRTSTATITPVEEPAAAPPEAAMPRTTTVGVIAQAAQPAVTAAAGLLGLPVEGEGPGGAARLVDRALADDWELIAAPATALADLFRSAGEIAAFVGRGGTLLVDGLDERSNRALRRLGACTGGALPAVRPGQPATGLLFPAERAAFGGPLAGTALATRCGDGVLEPCAREDVLAWAAAGGGRRPAVVQRRIGRGRIVLSALPTPGAMAPADVLASGEAGALVVALLLLRQVYGAAAWHAPLPLANFTIDDPALRQGLLGLRYDLLSAQAREHRFHVTVATVPRELALAEPDVMARLRGQPEVLSACYHGCDHDGYEFYRCEGTRTAYRPRPLVEQRAALRRAVEHGRRFAVAGGRPLDRVMVFPYGVGPARLLGDLRRLGFVATCNYWDKYPLEAPVPARPDLGLRPADLAWEGYPLLWRRSLGDGGFLLDLLLGRPALGFGHRRELGRDFAPFVRRAAEINRAARGTVAWCGLDEVARHAHLQRRGSGGWEVLMTGDEACLHNPDPAPRTCSVTRPDLPAGSRLEADGARGGSGLLLTIPAGASRMVRVVGSEAAPPLGAGPPRCSIFREDRR